MTGKAESEWLNIPFVTARACCECACVRACMHACARIWYGYSVLHNCVESRLSMLEAGNLVFFLFYFCNVLLVSVLFRTRCMRDHIE